MAIDFLPVLEFLLCPLELFGFHVFVEYGVDALDYQNCWVEWTTGLSSRDSAEKSLIESMQRCGRFKLRVSGKLVIESHETEED